MADSSKKEVEQKVIVKDQSEFDMVEFHQNEAVVSFCSGCEGVTSATTAFFS